MKIGLLPSTQWTSIGNGIGGHSEADLCQDVTKRLMPKLQNNGHTVAIFAGSQDANSDGAHALVAWKPEVAISLHLDSATGQPACLLCWQENGGRELGEKIQAAYCRNFGIKNKGGMKRTPGVNGVAVIRIPEAAGIPCALLELGDMNNPDGGNWITEAHREKAAQTLSEAICEVLGRTPVVKVKEMEVYMETVKKGKASRYSAYLNGQKLFVDVINNRAKPSSAQLTIAGDGGGFGNSHTFNLPKESSTARMEIGELTGNPKFGALIVKVVCLDGEIRAKYAEAK